MKLNRYWLLFLLFFSPLASADVVNIDYSCHYLWCYDESSAEFRAFSYVMGIHSCPGSLCTLQDNTMYVTEVSVDDREVCASLHYTVHMWVYPRSQWDSSGVPSVDLLGASLHCTNSLYGGSCGSPNGGDDGN